MLTELCRWGASQPWVTEDHERTAGAVWFFVDCPVLDCRELWFAVDRAEDLHDDRPLLFAAVPSGVAERGAALGWAQVISALGNGRVLVGVAPPKSGPSLRALQYLLQLAYSACFDATLSPG
jgi:hypothetical protein